MRLTGQLILALALALVSGCASNPQAVECATGIFCPEGFHCAAAEQKCIANAQNCGDAIQQSDEECDDGNLVAGDGCSPLCKLEVCGNGVKDPGEECDDGNTTSGDKCSATCKNEFCGNNITDPGEACDEGPTGGPTCNATCTSNLTCGNGIRDPGEACDIVPQNPAMCSTDCKSSRMCGNGFVDPGEECDNGNTDTGNGIFNADDQDCRTDCVINRCGDGFQNTAGSVAHREACDPATKAAEFSQVAVPLETNDCNLDCTSATCGDSKINKARGETCDDGAANGDDKDCTAGCLVARCGDGLPDTNGTLHHEVCDDGDQDNTNGCNTSCATKLCGNGVIDMGEQCDLGMGNNADGKDCTAGCQLAKCGDGLVHTGVEECDGAAGLQPCDNTTCKQQKCGNGIKDPGEDCDDHNLTPGDGCNALCKFEVCGDGVKNEAGTREDCDDGMNTMACNANCKFPMCGDGFVNGQFKPSGAANGEECDPPNPGMGCSSKCQFEGCGNGVVDVGEQCDGAPVGGFTCVNCHLDKCGNGVVDSDEQCDDGNNVATDGCVSNNTSPASCKFNVCGDGVRNIGVEECDDGSGVNGNGTAGSPNHCDAFCKTNHCGNGVIEQGEGCDDGMGNNGAGKHCNALCQLNTCGDGDYFSGEGACDKGGDNILCDSDCTLPVCGDGHKNAAFGETCDDGIKNGTAASPNNCSTNCKTQGCPNGAVDPGEDCDSNGIDTAVCNGATCKFADCGDGIKNTAAGESCDDGALNGAPCPYGTKTCTHCKADCSGTGTFAGPFCGDNNIETGETCDDGNAVTETSADCPYQTSCANLFCKADCSGKVTGLTPRACGDGTTDPEELCDDNNTNACGACSADCSMIQLAAATGTLFTPDGASIANNEFFTLNDGFLPSPIKYQFYTGSAPAAPTVGIMIDNSETQAQMRTKIQAAIAGSTIGITATISGSFINLTNKRLSSKGNTTSTENVASPNFALSNMAGGLGGDCNTNTGCTQNDDCTSHVCTVANKCM